MMIRFSRKLEKNSFHQPRGESLVAYDDNILNDVLSKRDRQIKDDPIEDFEQLVEGMKNFAEFASLSQVRSDRISITTKELLEKRRKLKLDPAAARST